MDNGGFARRLGNVEEESAIMPLVLPRLLPTITAKTKQYRTPRLRHIPRPRAHDVSSSWARVLLSFGKLSRRRPPKMPNSIHRIRNSRAQVHLSAKGNENCLTNSRCYHYARPCFRYASKLSKMCPPSRRTVPRTIFWTSGAAPFRLRYFRNRGRPFFSGAREPRAARRRWTSRGRRCREPPPKKTSPHAISPVELALQRVVLDAVADPVPDVGGHVDLAPRVLEIEELAVAAVPSAAFGVVLAAVARPAADPGGVPDLAVGVVGVEGEAVAAVEAALEGVVGAAVALAVADEAGLLDAALGEEADQAVPVVVAALLGVVEVAGAAVVADEVGVGDLAVGVFLESVSFDRPILFVTFLLKL